MKKAFCIIALVGFIAGVLLTGCKKQEPAPPVPPTPPSTNAPAAPTP